LYTSPHLLDFAERIQIDGKPVSHSTFVELVEKIKPAVASIEKLTTFEITTALGFLAFARAGCKAAVVEVGLGGRLDATNVVSPLVSSSPAVIRSWRCLVTRLTRSLPEKGRIIKQGIPVVSAPQKDEALEVLLRVAKERGSSFTLVGRDIHIEPVSHSLAGQTIMIREKGKEEAIPFSIPLLGFHQLANAATATLPSRQVDCCSDDAIKRGFAVVNGRPF
jgi:dihydrofolate synthase/folylpolyglutamate synthase